MNCVENNCLSKCYRKGRHKLAWAVVMEKDVKLLKFDGAFISWSLDGSEWQKRTHVADQIEHDTRLSLVWFQMKS